MKFSADTVTVLKNFSTINPGVIFKKGHVLRTISPQKTIMASATISDDIESDAGVFDIGRFLGTLSLFENPDIEFGVDRFTVKDSYRKLNYTYTPDSMIVAPPDNDIVVPDPEAVFDIEWKDLESVIRAAGVLSLPEISFVSDGKDVVLCAVNSKNPTADNFSAVVAENLDAPKFNMVIKTENLKLLPMDYKVSLSSKGMAHFKSDVIQYWVAISSE